MARIGPTLVFLTLFLPFSALAQDHIFEKGDSGVSVTYDFHTWKQYDKARNAGTLRGAYTYKGLFNIGLGESGVDPGGYSLFRIFFLGRLALLNPDSPVGSGPIEYWNSNFIPWPETMDLVLSFPGPKHIYHYPWSETIDFYYGRSSLHGPEAKEDLRPALLLITGAKGD